MNDQFVLLLNKSYLNSGKLRNSGQFTADQTFHYIESRLYPLDHEAFDINNAHLNEIHKLVKFCFQAIQPDVKKHCKLSNLNSATLAVRPFVFGNYLCLRHIFYCVIC